MEIIYENSKGTKAYKLSEEQKLKYNLPRNSLEFILYDKKVNGGTQFYLLLENVNIKVENDMIMHEISPLQDLHEWYYLKTVSRKTQKAMREIMEIFENKMHELLKKYED